MGGPKTRIGMALMRCKNLSAEDKDCISRQRDQGTRVTVIAAALGRSKFTIYNYLYYYYQVPPKQGKKVRRTEEGRNATCPTCERHLFMDTDGNGHLVEYCLTCVPPAA